MVKLSLIIGVFFLLASSEGGKISPKLSKKLTEKPSELHDLLVSFTQGTSSVYKNLSNQNFVNRANKIQNLFQSLQAHSSKSQTTVQKFLNENKVSFTSLWVSNQIFVQNADADLVAKLAEFKEVSVVLEDAIIPLDAPAAPTVIRSSRNQGTLASVWGIEKIAAEEAQLHLNQTVSSIPEVRVIIIDTGARPTHEALIDNYVGDNYGWYEPVGNAKVAYDDNGHGTHAAGTVCGKFGIGVFPEAKFMACKACSGAGCATSSLIQCGQFALCPHLPDGTGHDCSKAAHVSSNSWGGGRGETWYDSVIDAYHAAGIIPVFANGNSGPFCSQAASPADRNVIGVGSTTVEDNLSYFSSPGPAADGNIKPDISAPGSDITSAWHLSDTSYAVASGTSFACPHIAGVAALLLAYRPSLTFQELRAHLINGVDTLTLISQFPACGDTPSDVFPNNAFGHGRVNALKSLWSLIESEPTTTEATTTTTEEVTTPEVTTTEKVTSTSTTTTEAPEPINGCSHGPIWYPDDDEEPNLVCVCQQEQNDDGYFYKCITAASG